MEILEKINLASTEQIHKRIKQGEILEFENK